MTEVRPSSRRDRSIRRLGHVMMRWIAARQSRLEDPRAIQLHEIAAFKADINEGLADVGAGRVRGSF